MKTFPTLLLLIVAFLAFGILPEANGVCITEYNALSAAKNHEKGQQLLYNSFNRQ